uniref:Uncharacterized protein n=1 Tax=Oryza brachyantha TaxID=4533 RepID=J3N1G2_ORYBR
MESRGRKHRRGAEAGASSFGETSSEEVRGDSCSSGDGDVNELECAEDSSDAVGSDAASPKVGEDDVAFVAEALRKISRSPEALRDFVRRSTPAAIARHIDWDIVREPQSTEAFLRACIEERGNGTLDTTNPSSMTCRNLARKMKLTFGKNVTKQQCLNFWDACKKRHVLWKWLVTEASGLDRVPGTDAIVASPEWWALQGSKKKNVLQFRNDQLSHIKLDELVFGSSKRSRSSSAMESRAKEEQAHRGCMSGEAALELLENDGYHCPSQVWLAAANLFESEYYRSVFIDWCETPAARLDLIRSAYRWKYHFDIVLDADFAGDRSDAPGGSGSAGGAA